MNDDRESKCGVGAEFKWYNIALILLFSSKTHQNK